VRPPQGLSRQLLRSVVAEISTAEDVLVVRMPVPLFRERCPQVQEAKLEMVGVKFGLRLRLESLVTVKWYVNSYETLKRSSFIVP
jgi:hypothetical protein